jgi:hypothetical protein
MLVVHIGTHKTGTSALQKTLARNADRLLKRGVRYLSMGREGAAAHHELARALKKRGDKTVWQKVRKELSESEARINLISSEGFWFSEPANMKEQLEGVGDIRIIAYLRRQDRYLQSLYKQAVAGGRKISFAVWLKEMGRRGNYLPVIERWAAQFGDDAITIRPYEREGHAIDSIEDFGSFLGCSLLEQQKKGKIRGNASPRRELLHFIRAFNKLNFEVNRDEFFFSLIHKDKEYIRSGDLLSAAESAAMMREFEDENRVLVEKYYGKNQTPLFPALDENAAAPAIWGLDDRAFFDLTADVIDVIVRLAAEGKIQGIGEPSRRKGGKSASAAAVQASPEPAQTRQDAGNAEPNLRRQYS